MKQAFYVALAMAAAVTGASADPIEGKPTVADIINATGTEDWRALDPENTLYIELKRGRVVVALSSRLAQNHVAAVKELAREGFYDGLSFYRVIDGFVAQGGDALGVRGEKKKLAAEFEESVSENFDFYRLKDKDGYAKQVGFVDTLPVGYDPKTGRAWHLHCTGAFAFGREDGRDTASTEFYVALQPQRYLDRNMSVLGRVVAGMEHLQALRRVSPPQSTDGDFGEKIIAMRVAADVPEAERANLEILRSDRPAFDAFVEARRNRAEGFFHYRPDHVDVCQLPIPARPVTSK